MKDNGQTTPPLTPMRPKPLVAMLYSLGWLSFAAYGGPQGAVVQTGLATVTQSGTNTHIEQSSQRAVIDWRSFDVRASEAVLFNQPSRSSATLNRVTGKQLSMILGRIDANGQVVLVNPNGIIFGKGSQVNVGSLIASTANISNANFMAGRLRFDEPGQPGAGVINQGIISATDGGLVALVAPHVRNDGLIQARLGKMVLAAGNTFTLDLYGDGLINLAFTEDHAKALLDTAGKPVGSLITQTGKIAADGGQVVLITAPAAKGVLDQVINLSGTIQADTVAQQGGRIVLLGRGGAVEVTGSLSAQGTQAGQSGGTIEVLGDAVHLTTGTQVNASGHVGGGTLHIGGAFQGQGMTYRAQTAKVDTGAQLHADATTAGPGGEVVVWADGQTTYAGEISARGGTRSGDGGRVEVSGKKRLDFLGLVDAGASRGANGSLLLDPTNLTIGLAEAAPISNVLRTGTSTTLTADVDIDVNATIDGRGGHAGGGLTVSAGNNLNLGSFIITNDGAIKLSATGGAVEMAPKSALFAGNAPITVRAGGNITSSPILSASALSVASSGGSVSINGLIDANVHAVDIQAGQSLTVNQPVLNMRNGSPLSLTAGGDIVINAQIDGRGGAAGGGMTLAAGNNATINSSIVTNDGPISVDAARGSATIAPTVGLFAGSGPISFAAANSIATGSMITTGPLNVRSRTGSITVSTPIDGATGPVALDAANDVVVSQSIVNSRPDAPLNIVAGRDIVVNAQIDGRDAKPATTSGSISLTAGRNVALAKSIVTENAALSVTARSGTVHAPTLAAGTVTADPQGRLTGEGLYAGNAPISVSTGADLASGVYGTTGSLALRSTAGAVNIDTPIDETVGATTIASATAANVNQKIANLKSGHDLTISAGTSINVNARITGEIDRLIPGDTATPGGAATLLAGTDLLVNENISTLDAPLSVTAQRGTVSVASGKQLRSGSGNLTVSVDRDLYVGDPRAAKPSTDTPYATNGTLNVSSTAGTLFIEAPIPPSTGPVNLFGGIAVQVNERISSNNQNIGITAGVGGIWMNPSPVRLPTGQPAPDDQAVVFLSDTDARQGNLTLLAQGDITATSLRTAGTLTVTSRGGSIRGGTAEETREGWNSWSPQRVSLLAASGITFNVTYARDVEAISSSGAVNLGGVAGNQVRITTPSDITVGSLSGQNVVLSAGHDINLVSKVWGGTVSLTAGRNINLSHSKVDSLTITAGSPLTGVGDIKFSDLIWLNGGDLAATAGRDIVASDPFLSNIHISGGINAIPQHSATFSAGRSIDLRKVETLGHVSISATTGNIVLQAPIGPAYQDPPPCNGDPACGGYIFPQGGYAGLPNTGVASLLLSAPAGAITMAGARSLFSDLTFGFGLISSREIIPPFNLNAPAGAVTQILQGVPIGVQDQLVPSQQSVGGITPPGPLPAAPQSANGIVALAPIIPNIPVLPSAAGPGVVNGLAPSLPPIMAGDTNVSASTPGTATGPAPSSPFLPPAAASENIAVAREAARNTVETSVQSIVQTAALADEPASEATAGAATDNFARAVCDAGGDPGATVACDFRGDRGAVLVFSGGRGEAQSADLGRSGTFGSVFDVFGEDDRDAAGNR